ncbi:MAG: hypothetical protein RMM53_13540, partial [Bacteroidia bacterium]|nr:hypothetical protein [Bacteroidia bacterium]MDW8335232.1 hypothetical protein [Bacteroidia bacterium]
FGDIDAQAYPYLAAFGEFDLVQTWIPNPDGPVYAVEVDENNDLVYAGGNFSNIGGQPRNNMAALLAYVGFPSGAATAWNPGPDDFVSAIEIAGGVLYVGGNFDNISGSARGKAASFAIPAFSLNAWNPALNGAVYAIETSGSNVFLGGDFTGRLAKVDNIMGMPSVFPTANATVRALQVIGNRLFVGGDFTALGSVARKFLGAVNTADNSVDAVFNPNLDQSVRSLAAYFCKLIVGGDFTTVNSVSQAGVALINKDANISIAGPLGICQGGSATLTVVGSGISEYYWCHNGSTTASVTVSPTTTTTYSVTVKTSDGCIYTLTRTLSVTPLPDAESAVIADQALCGAGNIQLGFDPPLADHDYVWSPAVGLDDPNSH